MPVFKATGRGFKSLLQDGGGGVYFSFFSLYLSVTLYYSPAFLLGAPYFLNWHHRLHQVKKKLFGALFYSMTLYCLSYRNSIPLLHTCTNNSDCTKAWLTGGVVHLINPAKQQRQFLMISTQRKKKEPFIMILQEELWVSINSASFNPSSALCVHAELILLIVFNSDLHHFF